YNPRIYYGQLGPSYSIVGGPSGSKPHEFDRPAATGSGQVDNTHTGGGGIPISSLLNRLVYSIKLGDPSILFSSGINHDSQLLTVRNPTARVAAVAPWLTLDGDAYPVASGGHVLWVVDGYTSTNKYPYSQQVNLRSATRTTYVTNGSTSAQPNTSVNYLRNSVKATVDANTGQVHLYAWNQATQPDPLLRMWERAFPGLVEPQHAIPAALLPHLRYPQDLFNVQRGLLAKYHVTDPRQFYSGSDFWKVPADPTTGPTPTSGPAIPSTYMTLSPDGRKPATFALSTPMATLDRRNLAAFISVDSQPGPGYGKITVLQFPTNRTVEGPAQVQQTVESDPRIARRFALLRTQHSRVVLGNLLTLPVGGGVMYVEPIYTRGRGAGAFAVQKRVIVRYNGRFGYRSTLRGALDQALGRP
ncbi:MAG TPA: UPF0182 family protein, partial [Mycobacteriales bacterium]|nr:UPF0182 family protein [Mycobacteriales bacterium]